MYFAGNSRHKLWSLSSDLSSDFFSFESGRVMCLDQEQQGEVAARSRICRSDYIRGIASKYGVGMSLREALLQKLESTDFRCFYTGVPLVPGINACVDHLHSRSQHPDKLSDLDNLVWCDKWINRMKGHMSYQEFISLCRTIVERADAQ